MIISINHPPYLLRIQFYQSEIAPVCIKRMADWQTMTEREKLWVAYMFILHCLKRWITYLTHTPRRRVMTFPAPLVVHGHIAAPGGIWHRRCRACRLYHERAGGSRSQRSPVPLSRGGQRSAPWWRPSQQACDVSSRKVMPDIEIYNISYQII